MKKIIVGIFSLALLLGASSVLAGSVTWNTSSNDCRDIAVANYTTNTGYTDPCWTLGSVNANPSNSVNVRIYYHNTGTETATNTRIILNAPTINNATSTHSFTGQIVSDQGSISFGPVYVNLSSAQKLTFGSTRWYPNQSESYQESGNQIISGGLYIGSIAPGWATQGSVVASFYVNNPAPTGTLTASTSNCTIQTGAGICSIPFTWNTNNPKSGVTSNITDNNGQIVRTGNSGSQSFNIPFGTSTFRLNHDSAVLDTETVSASCSSLNEWNSNSSTCQPIKPTGNLTASISNCLIQAGNNSCNISFSWSTVNPINTSTVTRDGGSTVGTGNNMSNVSLSIPFTGATFRLYNGGYELDSESVTASCATGTNWNGTSCALPLKDCSISSFTSNKTEVGSGDAVTLYWTTNDCKYVDITPSVGSGLSSNSNKIIYPSTTTTYTLKGYGDTSVSPTRTLTIVAGAPVFVPGFPAGVPGFDAVVY